MPSSRSAPFGAAVAEQTPWPVPAAWLAQGRALRPAGVDAAVSTRLHRFADSSLLLLKGERE